MRTATQRARCVMDLRGIDLMDPNTGLSIGEYIDSTFACQPSGSTAIITFLVDADPEYTNISDLRSILENHILVQSIAEAEGSTLLVTLEEKD